MFEVADANGWTGIEIETLDAAATCVRTIVEEGYEAPFRIFPVGAHYAVETWDYNDAGELVCRTTSVRRRYDGRAA